LIITTFFGDSILPPVPNTLPVVKLRPHPAHHGECVGNWWEDRVAKKCGDDQEYKQNAKSDNQILITTFFGDSILPPVPNTLPVVKLRPHPAFDIVNSGHPGK
jgi:hypothetical protein